MKTMFRLTTFLALLAVPVAAGCDGKDKLYPVSGTITLDGNPLNEGVIYFYPSAGEGGGPEGGAFKDGAFNFQAHRGPKRVEIRAYRYEPKPGNPDPYANFVPARYNTSSELTAEVNANEENKFHFDMDSKPDSAVSKPGPARSKTGPARPR